MRRRMFGAGPGRLLAVGVLVGALLAFPLGAIASHQFGDVPNTNTFHADIDAIADAGVTTGCGGGNYCPKDFVTREQMAAFLNRLGALAPGKVPVVNAAKIDGVDDVLAAGDIVIEQQGPWINHFGTTVDQRQAWAEVNSTEGDGHIGVALQSPGTIGGQVYGLKSVRYCVLGSPQSGNVTIDFASIGQSLLTNPYFADLAIDQTNRSAAAGGCFTLTDPTPQAPTGPSHLTLALLFAMGAEMKVSMVTSTWTPIG